MRHLLPGLDEGEANADDDFIPFFPLKKQQHKNEHNFFKNLREHERA